MPDEWRDLAALFQVHLKDPAKDLDSARVLRSPQDTAECHQQPVRETYRNPIALRAKIQNDGGFPSGDYARGYFVIPNEYTVNQRNYTAIINRVLKDQENVECVTLRALKTAIAKKEAMRSGE